MMFVALETLSYESVMAPVAVSASTSVQSSAPDSPETWPELPQVSLIRTGHQHLSAVR